MNRDPNRPMTPHQRAIIALRNENTDLLSQKRGLERLVAKLTDANAAQAKQITAQARTIRHLKNELERA